MKELSKYHKRIRNEVVDVYDVLEAFECGCSASEHAVKKLLMAGTRGHKDRLKDLQEALQSIQRAIDKEVEKRSMLSDLGWMNPEHQSNAVSA